MMSFHSEDLRLVISVAPCEGCGTLTTDWASIWLRTLRCFLLKGYDLDAGIIPGAPIVLAQRDFSTPDWKVGTGSGFSTKPETHNASTMWTSGGDRVPEVLVPEPGCGGCFAEYLAATGTGGWVIMVPAALAC